MDLKYKLVLTDLQALVYNPDGTLNNSYDIVDGASFYCNGISSIYNKEACKWVMNYDKLLNMFYIPLDSTVRDNRTTSC